MWRDYILSSYEVWLLRDRWEYWYESEYAERGYMGRRGLIVLIELNKEA